MYDGKDKCAHLSCFMSVFVWIICVSILLCFASAVTVNAEETTETVTADIKEYKFNLWRQTPTSTYYWRNYAYDTTSEYLFAFLETGKEEFEDAGGGTSERPKYLLVYSGSTAGTLRGESLAYDDTKVNPIDGSSAFKYINLTPFSSIENADVSTMGVGYDEVNVTSNNIPIFDRMEQLKIYMETGESPANERDFGTVYDPNVPVPELTNLSHNGFTVANAADDLELDLVVKSTFYGLKHKYFHDMASDGVSPSKLALFEADKENVIDSHYYDCAAFYEEGYRKSEYNILGDYGCTNLEDLASDGVDFYTMYPTHQKLPDYSFIKHAPTAYMSDYNAMKENFDEMEGPTTMAYALSKTPQAETKYYVRFYQIDEDGSMSPGQWYCYTYINDNKIEISPVIGDTDGSPIETDPVDGIQDGDGNPDYGSGGGFDIDLDMENPINMLSSFLSFVMSLPGLFSGYSAFLGSAFPFVPSNVWKILTAGIGFSVVFLIFRAVT